MPLEQQHMCTSCYWRTLGLLEVCSLLHPLPFSIPFPSPPSLPHPLPSPLSSSIPLLFYLLISLRYAHEKGCEWGILALAHARSRDTKRHLECVRYANDSTFSPSLSLSSPYLPLSVSPSPHLPISHLPLPSPLSPSPPRPLPLAPSFPQLTLPRYMENNGCELKSTKWHIDENGLYTEKAVYVMTHVYRN